MGIWRQIGQYLFIVKKDEREKVTKWEGYMHRINRISLLMFLVALLILVVKLFLRK
jgi:hypothetical protein